MNKKKSKIVVNNSSTERWEKLLRFYKWFFSLFFLLFAAILMADHVFFLGLMFFLLGAQTLPLKVLVAAKEKLPGFVKSGLILLNVIGIYIAFLRIVNP